MRNRMRWQAARASSLLVALGLLVSAGISSPAQAAGEQLTVPKATCGPGDHPETALQGQVPAALRAAGFKGFNCNLELVGQSRGDGGNWQSAEYRDSIGNSTSQGKGVGHKQGVVCAYHGTAFTTANRTHVGVP
ncbi:MAG TPA: hypothetical protein VF304_05050, partial [Casimicrobiaceae bacterium]